MSNNYCDKHEYSSLPGGPKCPDCAELASLQKKLDVALLQVRDMERVREETRAATEMSMEALRRLVGDRDRQIRETVERCAKLVDSFNTFYWSDSQRNVVRIIGEAIRTGQPASNWERRDIEPPEAKSSEKQQHDNYNDLGRETDED